MNRWIGKVAVITGASSGIGMDISRKLAGLGLEVVGIGRRKEKIDELAKQVEGKIHALKCDLSVEEQIVEAFDWIKNNLGGVDVLVNNAGLNKVTSLNSGQVKYWKNILDVNVLGLSICTREALKSMRERGDNGHIVHINSIAGYYDLQFEKFPTGMYSASKHAVTSLTESLRVELRGLKSNIKVTSISPGSVDTDGIMVSLEGIDPSTYEFPSNSDPSAVLDPQDITEAVVYALSTRPKVQVHNLILQPIGQRIC